jgi:hypothetical protein
MDYHFIIKYIPDWAYFIMFGSLVCCACWCFYDEHLRGFVDEMIQCLKCRCLVRHFRFEKCARGRRDLSRGRRRIVVGLRVGDPITTAKVYPESVVV